jgi:hypothetical protein
LTIVWSSLEGYGKFNGAIMGIINGKNVANKGIKALVDNSKELP